MTYRSSIDIDAPVKRVWEALVDVERWPDWSPSLTSVERLEPGMLRPGSSARIQQPRLPLALWRVTELEPEKSFTWTSHSRGVTTVARHTLTAREEGGTRALGEIDQYGPLALLAKVFYSRLIKSYLKQEAQGLKQRCERG